ncbi:AAA family ATPase [Candidatus Micrarchaeota archaeon]|nr:AAA family ATPase [Candidatus Micrarchaeota archaeon]
MFVESVSLRNFKSFKSANVAFDSGFNAIVGPNGSGKTNIVDSLLFAFGESSLKAMRVKKTSDLLASNAGVAEVTVVLSDGEKKHSVARVIRKDGKQKYSMDGRRVKKYVIEEFLSKHKISLHNVIKQGEVQRIVEMNPKDRRGLIDFVANVSEYESKKKEALGELNKVQQKLNESNVLLGEKEGFLKDLAEEKENAEKFIELDARMKTLKATLFSIDLSALQKDFDSLVSSNLDLESRIKKLHEEIKLVDEEIISSQKQVEELNQQVLLKGKGKEVDLQREIDELNNLISQGKLLIDEKKAETQKLEAKHKELGIEKQKAFDEVKAQKIVLDELTSELSEVSVLLKKEEGELFSLVGENSSLTKDFHSSVKKMQSLEEEMLSVKERLNEIQAENGKQKELQRIKEHELDRLKRGVVEENSSKLKELLDGLKAVEKDLFYYDKQVSELFSEEKTLNKSLQEAEKDLIEARKKVSFHEQRLRQAGGSSGLMEASNSLKQFDGVYGVVQELVDFDSKYAVPISIGLGARLSFIVVDSVKTAGKCINHLKKNNLTRMSFIPLDKIQASGVSKQDESLKKEKGSVDFLINLLDFDAQYKKALEYCCGNTLVMKDFNSAEELVGEARLVTMDGELFEQSGLVTGGASSGKINPFLESKELDKWDLKLKELESTRLSVIDSLNSNRESASESRKKKAEAELRKKTFDLEIQHLEKEEKENKEKLADVRKAVSELEKEILSCLEAVNSGEEERRELVRKLSQINIEYLQYKEKTDVEKQEAFGNSVKEKERKVSDLKIRASQLSSEKSSAETKHSVFEKQLASIKKQEDELIQQQNDYAKVCKEADSRIKKARDDLREKLEEQKKVAGNLKELWDARSGLEKKIRDFGEKKSKLQFELEEKIKPNKQSNEVKRAGLEEKIKSVKFQLDDLGEVTVLKKNFEDKPGLQSELDEVHSLITSLGSINMRAIEDYDRKAKDLLEQRQRVDQLGQEREAVIGIINEIEGRKIATFMDSFNAINKNFQHLFGQIFTGKGSLFLENSENPFEGGLTIQVQLDNKEVKYLELMSGGEKSLIALVFLFAMQGVNPSGIYVLDEADAALDNENSRKLQELISALSNGTQFLVVTHNETVYKKAGCLVGVAMQGKEGSKLVEVKLSSA